MTPNQKPSKTKASNNATKTQGRAASQNPRVASALFQELNKVRGKIQVRPTPRRKEQTTLPPTTRIGADGVEHINIYQLGKTELGRALSPYTHLPFKHCKFGSFASLEGFWHYIKSDARDDRMRTLYGFKARTVGDTIPAGNTENFKAIVMDANYQKIKSYPALLDAVKESTLPFDMYYLHHNDDDVRIRVPSAMWVVPGFEEIRRAIKAGVEPDFGFLMNNRKKGPLWPEVKTAPNKRKDDDMENMTINNTGAVQTGIIQIDSGNVTTQHLDEPVPAHDGDSNGMATYTEDADTSFTAPEAVHEEQMSANLAPVDTSAAETAQTDIHRDTSVLQPGEVISSSAAEPVSVQEAIDPAAASLPAVDTSAAEAAQSSEILDTSVIPPGETTATVSEAQGIDEQALAQEPPMTQERLEQVKEQANPAA